jgi:hypothetical protein
MKLSILAIVMLLVASLVGCGWGQLPSIDGYHWERGPWGAELYDSHGIEVASFSTSLAGEPAQVCVFVDTSHCQYRETNAQALGWLKEHMETKDAKGERP